MAAVREKAGEGAARVVKGAEAAKSSATGAILAAVGSARERLEPLLPAGPRGGRSMPKGGAPGEPIPPLLSPRSRAAAADGVQTLVDPPATEDPPTPPPMTSYDLLSDINPAHGRRGERKWIALDLDPKPWNPPPPGTPPTPLWSRVHRTPLVVRLRMIPTGSDCPPLVFSYERPSSIGSLFGRTPDKPEAVLKIRQNMEYGVIFRIIPPLPIRSKQVRIGATPVSRQEEPVQRLEETLQLTPCREGYCGTWTCSLPSSKSGVRHNMTVMMDIKGYGVVELPISVKSFPEEDYGGSMKGAVVAAVTCKYELKQELFARPSLLETEVHPSPWKL